MYYAVTNFLKVFLNIYMYHTTVINLPPDMLSDFVSNVYLYEHVLINLSFPLKCCLICWTIVTHSLIALV